MTSKTALLRRLIGPLLAASVLMGAPASAELVATPLRGDSRLVQFIYDADNTYLVLTKPKAVTHIQFGANEIIRSVAAGDTANWQVKPTADRKHLFVKPNFEDLSTSMTVLTDHRTYQFVLRSTGDGKKWYQRVSWQYDTELVVSMEGDASPAGDARPATELAATVAAQEQQHLAPGVKPDALRFSYEVSGDAPFRPLVVFDDGRFTYFKMPPKLQELPALFAVIDGTDFALVNFEVKGEYLVAQRVLPAAVLKLGRAEVRVSQAAPKRGLFGLPLEN